MLTEKEIQCTVGGSHLPSNVALGDPRERLPCSCALRERIWPHVPGSPPCPLLRKSHTQGPGVRSVVSQGPGSCMKGCMSFGEGVLAGDMAHHPHCTLQSTLVPSLGPSPAPHMLLPWQGSCSITALRGGGEQGEANGSGHGAAQQTGWRTSPPEPPAAQPGAPELTVSPPLPVQPHTGP